MTMITIIRLNNNNGNNNNNNNNKHNEKKMNEKIFLSAQQSPTRIV